MVYAPVTKVTSVVYNSVESFGGGVFVMDRTKHTHVMNTNTVILGGTY